MNLRRKRHDLQMTQEELAERAGLSARYVGAIERGDVSASVTVLGQIRGGTGNRTGRLAQAVWAGHQIVGRNPGVRVLTARPQRSCGGDLHRAAVASPPKNLHSLAVGRPRSPASTSSREFGFGGSEAARNHNAEVKRPAR